MSEPPSQPPGGFRGPSGARRPEDFFPAYTGVPPWDIGRPQPVFQALADSGELRGRVLDAGCGTGEHALLAASLGLPATGVDTAEIAIGRARDKARDRGLSARFVVHNALDLGSLGERFDTVLDSGLFHVFSDADRQAYVASLAGVLVPGGRCYLLCFSAAQPGDWGPRRIGRDEIRAAFATGWRVDSIEPAILAINGDQDGVQAWFVTIIRT